MAILHSFVSTKRVIFLLASTEKHLETSPTAVLVAGQNPFRIVCPGRYSSFFFQEQRMTPAKKGPTV